MGSRTSPRGGFYINPSRRPPRNPPRGILGKMAKKGHFGDFPAGAGKRASQDPLVPGVPRGPGARG